MEGLKEPNTGNNVVSNSFDMKNKSVELNSGVEPNSGDEQDYKTDASSEDEKENENRINGAKNDNESKNSSELKSNDDKERKETIDKIRNFGWKISDEIIGMLYDIEKVMPENDKSDKKKPQNIFRMYFALRY